MGQKILTPWCSVCMTLPSQNCILVKSPDLRYNGAIFEEKNWALIKLCQFVKGSKSKNFLLNVAYYLCLGPHKMLIVTLKWATFF